MDSGTTENIHKTVKKNKLPCVDVAQNTEQSSLRPLKDSQMAKMFKAYKKMLVVVPRCVHTLVVPWTDFINSQNVASEKICTVYAIASSHLDLNFVLT